jgi:hypothetical protein
MSLVISGLVPGIYALRDPKTWIAGSSPAITARKLVQPRSTRDGNASSDHRARETSLRSMPTGVVRGF